MIRAARVLLSARISRFALIGAFGAVLNILIMIALVGLGADYVSAAIVAGEITIITNFIMQEKLAFADLSDHLRPFIYRFFHSFTFNTFEAVARVPLLWILVEYVHLSSPVAQAGTLCAAFFVRYAFHIKFVYARKSLPAVAGSQHAALLLEPGKDNT